ncbi:DUF362 domain-containing protein [bacterium]|nr:DUF362 domain-containing protein [bacterium]
MVVYSEGRRKMLAGLAALGGAAALQPFTTIPALGATENLVRVKGSQPYANTKEAVRALGGMERFVKRGQTVCILPNLGWARTPEQAACTHPRVLRAIVHMCEQAGAKSIDVYCNPCNDARVCYQKSGAEDMLKDTSARLQFISSSGWVKIGAPRGTKALKGAQVYRLTREADVHINVPILKHHGGAQMTMCMKNLMGAVKDRGVMHQDLTNSIPDAYMMIPSKLYVLDATRILRRNGPSGGNTKDTEQKNTVFAGVNGVSIDALGAELFGVKPSSIKHIAEAGRRGLGEINPSNIRVKSLAI